MANVPPACLLSSSSLDNNIVDYSNVGSSITSVLNYCKSKILKPYLRLLSLVGLKPLMNRQEPCLCLRLLNNFYTVLLFILLLTGYALQYMACFRRDRGFCYMLPTGNNNTFLYQIELHKQIYDRVCHGSILFSFLIPSLLHLFGYLHAFCIVRHSDEEDQLPVLMERVFLFSNGQSSQKKIIRILWCFVILIIVWMVLSLVVVIIMVCSGNISFKWNDSKKSSSVVGVLQILLIVSTLWHDIVQITIISNYCLQVQLLTIYLQFLQEKLLQSPIEPLEWIRFIETIKKMLDYVNKKIAPSVSLFSFMDICWGTSGILWLLNYDNIDKETIPLVGISTVNVTLWILIGLIPFIQASRLSNECEVLRNVGQEVRTRPFAHQDTPGYELDSILLYTASLKMKAKLFYIPITGKYLCLFFVLAGFSIVVLEYYRMKQ